MPYELRGRGKIEIKPEGCHAFVEFPLQPGASLLETDAPVPSRVSGGSIDMAGEPSLAGQTVLVLEKDFYLAQDFASALRSAEAKVIGPCATSAEAIQALKRSPVTAAMIEVNFGTGPSFDVAHALQNTETPFVVLTGYDQVNIPEPFAEVSRLQKPAGLRDIVRAVSAFCGRFRIARHKNAWTLIAIVLQFGGRRAGAGSVDPGQLDGQIAERKSVGFAPRTLPVGSGIICSQALRDRGVRASPNFISHMASNIHLPGFADGDSRTCPTPAS